MLRTALTRRPAATPEVLRDPFGRFFDRFFEDLSSPVSLFNGRLAEELGGRWLPSVDLRQTDDAYVVEADLPGLTKDDVEVSLEDNVLTLSGERRFEKGVKEDSYGRVERAYGKFSRSFSLPGNVDVDKVGAAFKNGVLTITVPKLEEAKSRKVKVQ